MDNPFIITVAQINPTVGDLAGNLDLIRKARDSAPPHSNLIVFPELVVTGYPPEDLLLKSSFLGNVDKSIQTLVDESKGRAAALLVSAPFWHKSDQCLYNAVHLIHQGQIIATRFKHNLPNYGIFDEPRYFIPGPLPEPIPFLGLKLGVMICEDMWYPKVADHLKSNGADILIVTNASPYERNKHDIRLQHAKLRVEKTGLPLVWVNQCGAQDELVFDGSSFMMNETGRIILQCDEFSSEFQDITLAGHKNNSWIISTESIKPRATETESMYRAITMGTRDYIEKNKVSGVILGLSGGIDSALVATIAVDALGSDRVRCVLMPSPYTSQDSIDDATDCAKKLGVQFEVINIEVLMKTFSATLPNLSGIAVENIQSRLRGMILMALSNQTGWIVLTTGNKSEIAAGYSTLYGDMCGGYNPVKDLYKTQVYNLAEWRNSNKPLHGLGPDGDVINQRIITKAPTAELKPNQKDQDSLPPYNELDLILMGLIEEDVSESDLIEAGYEADYVQRAAQLLKMAEYKRRQSVPGPKVSQRAFGRDRRYPIINGYKGISAPALKNSDKPDKN